MVAANRLAWLDGQMTDGREYICGKRFTLADIVLFCWLDFAALVGQEIDPANTHIKAWFDRVAQRASLKADPVNPPSAAAAARA
jgi:glutathione S-transferase